ncbi:MAG: serpin family protein [Opitutaceae bacterium]|nr:serpin family protein [Opitutaceae bacterium]
MRSRLLPFQPGSATLAAILIVAASATGADRPAVETVAAANTAFALDLYRQLAPAPGNLFFSPSSVSEVLGMALVGARGQTAAEMAATLHLNFPPDQVVAGLALLADRLGLGRHDGVTLVTANSIWAQSQTPLLPEFLHSLRTQFSAEATSVDFGHAAEAARTRINVWVADKTRNKIPELIGAGMLDTQTRMVLVNAIYFKGRWAGPFEPRLTRPASFFLAPTRSVEVPTMHRTSKLRTVALDGLRLIELPYSGQTISLVILLPDASVGLAAIERDLTPEKLGPWLTRFDAAGKVEVALALPRFSTAGHFDLGWQLGAMGMPAAFDPNAADFSGMTGDRSLFLSTVIHQAVVEVNEEGTEAAAASGGVYAAFAVMRPLEIQVDHPFLFLIRDQTTGTLLFLGRIVDPR